MSTFVQAVHAAAPFVFIGVQDCGGIVPDFALYNLLVDVPGHPAGSTVSEDTLRKLGFLVPTNPR